MAALAPLRVPLQALAVGLAGVGLAWLWFEHHRVVAVLAVVGAIALGRLLDAAAGALLPGKPVGAVRLLEWWLLVPLAIAAAAAAAAVIVTVELTLPDGTPTETAKLVGATSTGITTFLTAGFVSWTSDADDSTLGNHIRDAFQSHYGRAAKPDVHVFKADSAGERWVYGGEYGGIEGWGRAARIARAKGIAAELKSKASDP